MRASIRTLISTVGLVALLGGCATQEEPLTSDTIPAPLKSTMEGTLPSAILSKALERDGYVLNWSRAQVINTDEFLLTSVPLKHTAGQFIVAEENGSVKFAQVGLFTQNGEVLKNWPICHRPPGNPKNAHTIYVGEPAVSTHLTKHDDSLGFCGSDATTSEGGYSYAVLVAGQTALTGYGTFNNEGEIQLREAGESVGTDSLEALLTVKSDASQNNYLAQLEAEVRAHNESISEILGDKAEPFLWEVPSSAERAALELGTLDVILRPQGPTGPCGRNGEECSGGNPGGGDPAPTPDPDPPPSPDPDPAPTPDPDTDGGSGDDDGDDGDDDGGNNDDGPSSSDDGPSYDTAELIRLTDELEVQLQVRDETEQEFEKAVERVVEAQGEVNRVSEELSDAKEEIGDLVDQLIENNTAIGRLDEVEAGAVAGAYLSSLALTGGAAGVRAAGAMSNPAGVAAGGGATSLYKSVETYLKADAEQQIAVQSNEEILAAIPEIRMDNEVRAYELELKQGLLDAAETSQSFWGAELADAENEVRYARRELEEFKNGNGIEVNPFEPIVPNSY